MIAYNKTLIITDLQVEPIIGLRDMGKEGDQSSQNLKH